MYGFLYDFVVFLFLKPALTRTPIAEQFLSPTTERFAHANGVSPATEYHHIHTFIDIVLHKINW
jgi:hypothetical protein